MSHAEAHPTRNNQSIFIALMEHACKRGGHPVVPTTLAPKSLLIALEQCRHYYSKY